MFQTGKSEVREESCPEIILSDYARPRAELTEDGPYEDCPSFEPGIAAEVIPLSKSITTLSFPVASPERPSRRMKHFTPESMLLARLSHEVDDSSDCSWFKVQSASVRRFLK